MSKRKPRFEVKRASNAREFYFVLVGANGEAIMTSERYPTEANARRGADDARAAAAEADIIGLRS